MPPIRGTCIDNRRVSVSEPKEGNRFGQRRVDFVAESQVQHQAFLVKPGAAHVVVHDRQALEVDVATVPKILAEQITSFERCGGEQVKGRARVKLGLLKVHQHRVKLAGQGFQTRSVGVIHRRCIAKWGVNHFTALNH